MRYLFFALVAVLLAGGAGCQQGGGVKPPVAKRITKKLEKHGDARTDNYYWLRERQNPEVIRYLEAENQYTKAMMAHTESLQAQLAREFKARIKQTDTSAPYRKDGYYYYTRVEEGKEYPVYCRKKGSLANTEEVMLDANKAAEGHVYSSVARPIVSPRADLMAYAADYTGRGFYTIRFKNLAAGKELKDAIPNVTGNLVWAGDNKTVFYSKQDPATLRAYRIYRHALGSDPAGDTLVFEEKDDTFRCFVTKTKSEKYVLIESQQTLSTEVRCLAANTPQGAFNVIEPRKKDLEYHVDHAGDYFYIRTNWNAKNFRLMKTPERRRTAANWKEVIPNRDDVFFEDFHLFKNHLVAEERKGGLVRLRIMPWSGAGEHYLDFGEPAYLAFPRDNYTVDTPFVRYTYTSLTTPPSVYDYNMATREKTLVKRDEILGGFDPNNYVTERRHAAAQDGARVPVSIVYRRGFRKDGNSPLLLYAYGSYGYSTDAAFNPFLVSLLDRGFAYAIAHVRGGQELGRQWYENGKLLKKKNTFSDFIASGEYLVRERYTSPAGLFANGGSAGGLLMGAVVNMRPDLFKGVVADVPWVDVVTTMLDDSIPLTTSEYDEWGNPNNKEYYDYMLSYSPYDQVKAQNCPNLLVTTSLPDSQVQYWEPAKWVAKLRATKTGDNLLLLKTEMEASHGGVTGRYKRYKDMAFRYAFLLDVAGVKR